MIVKNALILSLLLVIFALPLNAQNQGGSPSALKGMDVNQPLDLEADRLEILDNDATAQLIGNVIVQQGALTLKTNSLLIYYKQMPGKAEPTIIRIDALEPIRVESASETVTGDWGVYDVEKRIITVGGTVDLVRKDASLKGRLLQINLVDGITTLDSAALNNGASGRVKGRFLAPPSK